ncbi:stress responsive A/B barrel domain-containing protein [Nannizzia gypsea CBS 118893]|uniref:Stress responsive A/B barrel domain-containing protein n=1 Tax=Arthroderma gypseum (strain ATCC MYA-4604 / CBS 118893) TaxID=535722 RepID=E4UNB6_ARTGP|nr:stress responsive A/B barrel domain-containing protein [Nannizzia gypsea CBS 118893]EFQ99577.1 stress responsive A/B barrel domain-containing protein [Nannizzia gypsea CBS 118893]
MAIHRITFFNIPNPDDIDVLVSEYRALKQEAKRDSKPYILSVEAGRTLPDLRTQGYTLAVRTTFRNLDDMNFYDTECETHRRLKKVAAPRRQGDVFVAYFADELGSA